MRFGDAELVQAARWGLFVEKAVVMLANAEQAAAIQMKGASPQELEAKVVGAKLRDTLRLVMFPEDDDG